MHEASRDGRRVTVTRNGRRPVSVRLGSKLRPAVDRLIERSSIIPNAPVLDPAQFGWVEGLQAGWRDIRDEARRVLTHAAAIPPLREISPDHTRIAKDAKWRSFFLYGYGFRVEENCRRAPVTAAAVRDIPGLMSAFFSILEPGTHIPRHTGVTKAMFTAHLGLMVPADAPACHMSIADQDVHWSEGSCLIFDDTYPHEVWNRTSHVRVVLLMQLLRPVRFPGSLASRLFMGGIRRSAFVTDVRDNLADWELAYRRLERDEAA